MRGSLPSLAVASLLCLASCGTDETRAASQVEAAGAPADAAVDLVARGSKCAPKCPTDDQPYLTCSAGVCVCERVIFCRNGTPRVCCSAAPYCRC
jgi:hypothetical protein